LLWLAIGGEGALAFAGVVWSWSAGRALPMGPVVPGLLAGVLSALALAAVQLWLLRRAPDRGPVPALRRLYRETLRPLFARVSLLDIVIISALAGLGEELLFRGAIQTAWGFVPATLLFGLCHIGGRTTVPLGLWATVVGGYLGWLALATGGLLAPILAHALYDALALSYIRWGRGDEDASATGEARAPAPDTAGEQE
jgi:membrane protease YdiL (CAAX protease family)